MPENPNAQNSKTLPTEFSYYLVDFFMAVIIGLGVSILLDIPMKFMRVINMDIGAFIVHFLSMCIVLYIRSYRRGYHRNTQTYTFEPKKAALFVGIVFAVQIVLIFIIGGHAVYLSGPTVWFTSYILPAADRAVAEGRAMIAGYNWIFMILADIFVYAPIMILGEYWGDKQNQKQIAETK